MKYFIFNVIHSSTTYTVVFDYFLRFNEVHLREDVLHFHRSNPTCRKVIYIYPKVPTHDSSHTLKALSGVFNIDSKDIILEGYDKSGFERPSNRSRVALQNFIKSEGLLQIVKKRSAIIYGDELFHFVLPSQKHSSFFIRTGNVLQFNNEINFIAFCLLDELRGTTINHIACDTSSIISIGYAYQYLHSVFEGVVVPVYSFKSYQGIEDFEPHPRTLILISATNSGDLEKRITAKIKEIDVDVITVIYNGKEKAGRPLVNIYPLFQTLTNDLDVPIRSLPSDVCKLCNKNSIPVLIRGDQFMPSRVITQRVLLYKRQVPAWIKDTFEYLACSEAITCFRSENLNVKRREIFIDLEKLLDGETPQAKNFRKLVNRTINNLVPASVAVIVYLKDRSSELLAAQINSTLSDINGSGSKVIPHTKIRELQESDLPPRSSILVISACVASGNKLNNISRNLRRYKNSSIHYISFIGRLESSNSLDVLKGNLSYRGDKAECLNVFNNILPCYLGDYHDQRRSSYKKPPWTTETEFLSSHVGSNTPDSIKERLNLLASTDGLVNDLFYWNPIDNKKLRLRENFALYNFKAGEKPSQADVYFIMSACFHALRNPLIKTSREGKTDKYLTQHEHVKSIIDPQTFNRYNDGVIQACILRIARPIELSYMTEEDSSDISRVLIDLFKDKNDPHSNEALLEFLYAIASRKLTLLPHHLDNVCESIERSFDDHMEVRFFLTIIKDSVFRRSK